MNTSFQHIERVIISGGGTGGHIFPAIAIANALKAQNNNTNILFVGAQGKIEMEKVPEAGYRIVGLPIAGMSRKKISLHNLQLAFLLLASLWKAFRTIRKFKPQVVVGVGGYASGPTLFVAGMLRIPTLIQEQNSYAGITNKLLARKAQKICVAYNNMQAYFPAQKIIITGNPVREAIRNLKTNQQTAKEFFGLDRHKKTILILGGSLGARTINQAIIENQEAIANTNAQFLWQTGKLYIESAQKVASQMPNVKANAFIREMDKAYAAADIIVSRAGAGTISELAIVGKPVILIPSPNVAEDHQTKNAKALAHVKAALFIDDKQAIEMLMPLIQKILKNNELAHTLSVNISNLAIKDSDFQIAKIISQIVNKTV